RRLFSASRRLHRHLGNAGQLPRTRRGNAKEPVTSMRARLAIAAVAIAGGIAGIWVYTKTSPKTSPQANAYVDGAMCASCHPNIAATYRKTGMGRSFAKWRPERTAPFAKNVYNKTSDSFFAMTVRDGKYYQRRWQIGFDGKETNVDEKQVDYIIGS